MGWPGAPEVEQWVDVKASWRARVRRPAWTGVERTYKALREKLAHEGVIVLPMTVTI